MTIYAKPAVRSAWAQNAGGADLVDPGDSFSAAGFLIGVKPPRQYFNFIENFTWNGIRYLCQNGVVDYDAAETYQVGSVVMGPDFLLYQSIAANNIGHTPSSSPTFWGPMQGPTPAGTDNSHNLATTAFVNGNFILKTTTIGTLPGQLVNGQVPVGAVTQWQGSLSIAFSQMTGLAFPGQIPVGAVTQWQTSLSIAWGQITGTKNADLLDGFAPAVSAVANAIMVRDASGYGYAGYFNQSSGNNENPSISQIIVTNGSDNFFRKASVAALVSAIAGAQLKATNGYVTLPGGIIIQWGICNPNGGTVSFFFPIAFPNAAFVAVGTSTAVPTQCDIFSLIRTSCQVFNSGGQSFVIAIGF